MFKVGDLILYPMHGTSIVEAVEERNFLGEDKLFYILKLLQLNMKISVPMDKAIILGIRELTKPEVLEDILRNFNIEETDPAIFENQRYCKDINTRKIKSGNIYKGTEVIRDLTRKGQRNKLGTDDLKILGNARQVFLSEIMLVKGISQEQAVNLLDEALR